MPLAFCKEPNCKALTVERKRFCAEHLTDNIDRRRRLERPELDKWYGRASWKIVRDYKLRHDPMCEKCGEIATEVHHKDGSWKQKGEWREFINQSNLESLCHECHSKITMQENRECGVLQ